MTYSPLHLDTLENPFSVYQELRQHHPVLWHKELHAWVLSKYDDCKFILSDHGKFSRNLHDLLGLGAGDLEDMTIQSHDPPHSMPLRRAISVAFQKVDLEGICKSSLDQLNREIASCPEEGFFNFMSEVSAPVALNFACLLMGVPQIHEKDYSSIFLRITEAMDSGLDPKRQRPGVEATSELNELITNSIPKSPPGSVIYELFQDPNVQKMPAGYVRNTISAMFNAAYSTAYASMGSFLNLALTEHDLTNKIMYCPSPDAAVEELLRLTSPAQATMRFAAQDLYIRDVLIKKTDMVIVLMASANHDPAQFDRPNEFNPNRHSIAHLSFGWGVHFCVGAIPARTFLRQYLTRLSKIVTSLKLAEKPQWENTVTLRCLKTLLLKKRKMDQHTMADLITSGLSDKG